MVTATSNSMRLFRQTILLFSRSARSQYDFHAYIEQFIYICLVVWVDNIRMDLGEVGWGDVDWIGLAKDRNRWRAVVNSVLNLWVP
jgi:hypothetical protein